MPSKDTAVLHKILKHCNAILEYCEGCESLDDFQSEDMRVEASVFNLMQIGELAKQELSDACKKKITNIPWEQIYGMRNRIVHGYNGIAMNTVWLTIRDDIPRLRDEVKSYIEK